MRECASCYFEGYRRNYSANQWKKGEGYSKCPECVSKHNPEQPQNEWETFYCDHCGKEFYEQDFPSSDAARGACNRHERDSHAQWEVFTCRDCGKNFSEQDYTSLGAAQGACDRHERDAHGPISQTFKFFHGTTWKKALSINRAGFIPSSSGCLGPGIYVAREPKARRFAEDTIRHGSAAGGLVSVLVAVKHVKYVENNDLTWRDQGFDACRAERTSASTNMEWCIRNSSQVQVLNIERIDLRKTPCPVCKEKWFATLGHAVQHVESGSCPKCKGPDRARQTIYDYTQLVHGQGLLTDLSGYRPGNRSGTVPELPYGCTKCSKRFRQLSSLLEHKRATFHN